MNRSSLAHRVLQGWEGGHQGGASRPRRILDFQVVVQPGAPPHLSHARNVAQMLRVEYRRAHLGGHTSEGTSPRAHLGAAPRGAGTRWRRASRRRGRCYRRGGHGGIRALGRRAERHTRLVRVRGPGWRHHGPARGHQPIHARSTSPISETHSASGGPMRLPQNRDRNTDQRFVRFESQI